MAEIQINSLNKSFGKTRVVRDITLSIKSRSFTVIVGPSGCGKSTLLRMIAGLEKVDSGEIKIAGKSVNDLPPKDRDIAMVFQSYALYPHMTVFNNMAFGLKLEKKSKSEIEKRVKEASRILQIENLLDRKPKQLSGGQRQRVAIGRAITRNPKVFLFDEPLSNLDAALRVATRIELANLHDSMPDATMVYVTHDQVEAMTLASQIVVLSEGKIEQIGSPLELYENPENLFVAKFIGSPAMNIIPIKILKTGANSTCKIEDNIEIDLEANFRNSDKGKSLNLGFRPENLVLAKNNKNSFTANVLLVESLGEYALVYATIKDTSSNHSIIAKLLGTPKINKGDQVSFQIQKGKMHLFDEEGRRYLNGKK
ncbi:MAG: ABC transporter ATP-binding protein [Paracoccaceae bacterium]